MVKWGWSINLTFSLIEKPVSKLHQDSLTVPLSDINYHYQNLHHDRIHLRVNHFAGVNFFTTWRDLVLFMINLSMGHLIGVLGYSLSLHSRHNPWKICPQSGTRGIAIVWASWESGEVFKGNQQKTHMIWEKRVSFSTMSESRMRWAQSEQLARHDWGMGFK